MRIVKEETQQQRRRQPPFIILFVAIALLAASAWDLNFAWTSKSDLIPLEGTFQIAKTDVIQTSEHTYRGGNYDYRALELRFTLQEHDKLFLLVKSMGEDNSGYTDLLNAMKSSTGVTVWIRKDEEDLREPTVFQLDTNEHPQLIKLERLRFTSSPMAIFMAIVGLAFLLIFFAATYPERLRQLLFRNR